MEIDFSDYERSYLLTYLLNENENNKVLDRIYEKIKESLNN